jgi:FKBP-type peptidyl-prolyl cis-trans isomerase SlyD
MTVEKDRIVSIHYMLKDETGAVLEDNSSNPPEEYLHGSGVLLPGLERVLEGMKENEVVDVVVPPLQAYGLREASLMLEVSNTDLDEPEAIHEGDLIRLFDGTEGYVIRKTAHGILLDANHPLAGKELHYTIRVDAIRDASAEELLTRMTVFQVQGGCGPAGCC